MQLIGRRGFLNWLGLAGAAPLVNLAKASVVSASPRLQEILLLETFIAGFQYHDGMKSEVLNALEAGTRLVLSREPGNEYDRNAIAARTEAGSHLGYLPRADNQMLARMMDQGAIIVGKIARVDRDAPTWERVAVRVFVTTPAKEVEVPAGNSLLE